MGAVGRVGGLAGGLGSWGFWSLEVQKFGSMGSWQYFESLLALTIAGELGSSDDSRPSSLEAWEIGCICRIVL